MATTTTLITFLVRTPSTTRSVSLYGSWDNFTTPYPMKRDSRLGPEHWSGCHSFDNIICDGRVDVSIRPSRNGALRMGGTYWYFYKLDDEIEFHNSAEPSTTFCPMLPGQLVNVLEVPFALSGSRGRNASVSSANSELRTLNPADKYMNPRPVPTPPTTMRVTTSPSLLQISNSTATSPTAMSHTSLSRSSSKDNVKISNMHRLPRKASLETFARSALAIHKPAGLRQAFRAFRHGRSPSPDTKYQSVADWTPNEHKTSNSAPQTPTHVEASSYFEQGLDINKTPMAGGLFLRDHTDNFIPSASFLEHRRERSRSRSRSRDPSSLRNPLIVDENARRELETSLARNVVLDTVVEVASPQTPICLPGVGETSQTKVLSSVNDSLSLLQLEKRLPTLPNTPSSAYPPSLDNSPMRNITEQLQILDSRFSTSTIDTQGNLHGTFAQDSSRFSEWSTTSDLISPISDSTIDDSVASPILDERDDFGITIRPAHARSPDLATGTSRQSYDERGMFPSTSSTTISSTISTVPSTSHDDTPDMNIYGGYDSHNNEPDVGSHNRNGFMHYRLPEVYHSSEITLKPCNDSAYVSPVPEDPENQIHLRQQNQAMRDRRKGLPHSESMQQLIDELSYLSGAIIN